MGFYEKNVIPKSPGFAACYYRGCAAPTRPLAA